VKLADWVIEDEIGSGGNATVYRASHRGGDTVALKVLNSARAAGEPYRRFRNEIEALQRLAGVPGVLPLLEYNLPESPSRENRAWLAMPLATPIEAELEDADLEMVVQAVARIAATLAVVHGEHNLAHRDVKPGNLYALGGDWLVGDFGLVHIPDVEELTRSNRPMGPLHFAPYEMIVAPDTADPMRADVYSLAKTLWVLATEQRFPPEGHQGIQQRDFLLSTLRPHPFAAELDRLIDRMTLMNPSDRPSMNEVSTDLSGWLTLKSDSRKPVAAGILERLRLGLQEELDKRDLQDRRRQTALQLIRKFQQEFQKVNQLLLDIRSDAEIDRQDDKASWNLLQVFGEEAYATEEVLRHVRMSRIYSGQPGRLEYELKVSRSIELRSDGRLFISAFVQCGHAGVSGADMVSDIEQRAADVESMDAARIVNEAIAELWDKVQEGLATFANRVAPPTADATQ